MKNNAIYNKIVQYYLDTDNIFKDILYSNKIIKWIIDEMIYNFIETPTSDLLTWTTKTFWECNRVSEIVKDELLKIENPRIIWVSEINGIVYDENKMDDWYDVDWDTYTCHTALDLFIWNEKYTEIIKYHIDLTINQFYYKIYTNEYFFNNIENMEGNIFSLWSNSKVYLIEDDEYTMNELVSLWYEAEYYFNEWYFIKNLKKERNIPNDIFPSIILDDNPIITTYILKNYSLDNIILLKDKEFLLVNIWDDRLDSIYNGAIYKDLEYNLIGEYNY